MDNLYYKVKLYLEANSKTETEFNSNILLSDDGSGAYIKTWNVSGVTKPTDSQLNALATNATKELNNAGVAVKRKTEYLSWQEQLDKLYHDINDGKFGDSAKTGTWYTHIKSVKDANSKG
jgi:hypothetical protein